MKKKRSKKRNKKTVTGGIKKTQGNECGMNTNEGTKVIAGL
jgi:hypothetical protein